MDEILSPLPLLEAVFYRRSYDQACDFSYHNHILQGPYLRYMKQQLKSKDVGQFRLTLTQGKRRGRLAGIRLHSSSELTTSTLQIGSSEIPTAFIINVSGVDPQGVEMKWQLAFSSEDMQIVWLEALKKACEYVETIERKNEIEKLREIAKKMKDGVDVRRRLYQFKFYSRTFVGRKAVNWLRNYLKCNHSQAIAVGNRMLSCGLIHHITYEHLFSEHNLLFRFSADIDPLVTSEEVDDLYLKGDLESDSGSLMEALKNANQELKTIRFALSNTQMRCEQLEEKQTKILISSEKNQANIDLADKIIIVLSFSPIVLFSTQSYSLINKILFTFIFLFIFHLNFIQKRGLGTYYEKSKKNGVLNSDEFEDQRSQLSNLNDVDEGTLNTADDLEDDDSDTYDELINYNDEMALDAPSDINYHSLSNSPDNKIYSISSPSDKSTVQLANNKWPNGVIVMKRTQEMIRSNVTENRRNELTLPLHLHLPKLQSVIEIDSDLFVGKAFIVIANLPDSPHTFFASTDKRRKAHAIVQGRFKVSVPFSNAYTGLSYQHPLERLPQQWSLLRVAIQMLSGMQPGSRVDLKSQTPHALAPLVCVAQHMDISMPGTEPPICSNGCPLPISENLSIIDSKFSKMSAKKRMAYFSKRSNIQNLNFNPSLVYTFEFGQHHLDIAKFQADLGFMKYDVTRVLGSRPLQFMAAIWDPDQASNNTFSSNSTTGSPVRNSIRTSRLQEIISSPSNSTNQNAMLSSISCLSPSNCLFNFEIYHSRSLEIASAALSGESSPTKTRKGFWESPDGGKKSPLKSSKN